MFCFINFISGAKNVLVYSYRSEGLGRREAGREGGRETEGEEERKPCLYNFDFQFSEYYFYKTKTELTVLPQLTYSLDNND